MSTTYVVPEVTVPLARGAGNVAGFNLQNPSTSALAAHEVSFGMNFAEGQVPAGQTVTADIGTLQVPVQLDVKTTWPDGSARMAVVTMQQPALAPNATVGAVLALGGPAAAAPPVDISALTNPSNYNVTVSLSAVQEHSGTTTIAIPNQTINVGAVLSQALASGTVSYWLQGSQATQVRVETTVPNTPLRLDFDITRYADGSTSTDVQFNNDIAMQAGLGNQTISLGYNVAISQNGTTAFAKNAVSQWQYQTWDKTLWSNGAPQVNVQQDVAALERTGAVQNYDLTQGVSSTLIDREVGRLGSSLFGILGPGYVTQHMEQTGSRPDIGAQPQWGAVWLMSQNSSAMQYMLSQANVAGSVPWHFYDPTSGTYATVTKYPGLWDDPRGYKTYHDIGLSQPAVPYGQSGWSPDSAHQPDLSYLAYLATGDRYYLDQLNAQASWSELTLSPGWRNYDQGTLEIGQVRNQAWGLREIIEAAAANPDGSAEKAYFTQLATTNIQTLLNETKSLNEGQVSGWFPGNYGSNTGVMAPWQQDYLASVVGEACALGVPGATQVLAWETNFLAGRFLSSANGFNPCWGVVYNITLYDPTTGTMPNGFAGTPFTTWQQVTTASQAANELTDKSLSPNNNNYLELAKESLAVSITYTGSMQAMQAYGWLVANAPQLLTTAQLTDPTFDVVPRLADGNLLSNSMVFLHHDTVTTPVSLHGTAPDQLIEETGTSPTTITAGPGIEILFAGSGPTTLIGGGGDDEMFGGSGKTTFIPGNGNDFMQVGSGLASFDFSSTDIGHDIISGLRLGTDHITIAGAAAGSLALGSILAGTTQDAAGNAVIRLSLNHDITLTGITADHVSAALFT